MAHIAPSISFVRETLAGIERGQSLGQTLQQVIWLEESDFYIKMRIWWNLNRSGSPAPQIFKTHFQVSFIELLENGLLGAPVYEHMKLLESEMLEEFDRQWKASLENLPLKLSVPLLLCFFPSYIILLFGPLLVQFIAEVQ